MAQKTFQLRQPRIYQTSLVARMAIWSPSHGLSRYCSILCGLFFVGLAVLGAFLPILPTTPFLILASSCFVRSSPRMHRWLLSTPFWGRILTDWEQQRSIPLSTKIAASIVIGSVVIFGSTNGRFSMTLLLLMCSMSVTGLIAIWSFPSSRR